jgi:hypothetical protein
MAFRPLDTDEQPAWDVLRDSEIDLLIEVEDLRSVISERVDWVQVVLELLAAVRDGVSRRGAGAKAEDLA